MCGSPMQAFKEVRLHSSSSMAGPRSWSTLLAGLCTILIFIISCVEGLGENKVLYVLGFYKGTNALGGRETMTAVRMALDEINSRSDILYGYQLNFIWEDEGQCAPGLAINNMYRQLYKPPVKIMIYGADCSPVTEKLAVTSQLWNLITLSHLSGSPSLSNNEMFKKFFRLSSPRQHLIPAHLKMMRTFNWRHMATLDQPFDLFTKVTDYFIPELRFNNLTLLTSEISTYDPAQQVANLKRHDARIIFVGAYDTIFTNLYCEIYKNGMYGSKYVWIINGFSTMEWWRRSTENVDCNVEDIIEAAEGTFGTAPSYVNYKEIKGIGGHTPNEWMKMYLKKVGVESHVGQEHLPITYDTAWAAALALNHSVQLLKDWGSNESLETFKYQDSDVPRAIFEGMSKTEFQGLKGYVKFDENGDNEASVVIRQIQDGKWRIVGHYDPYEDQLDLSTQWPIVWQGGYPPKDSTRKEQRWIFVDSNTYTIMCSFTTLGIILSLTFGIFNLVMRKRRIIKMSSPKMNNMIIAGCVVIYVTVFLQERSEIEVLAYCKARTCTLMVGFSIAFGALFVKTWRVYAIFMNRTKKVMISDIQLFLLVVAITVVDITILVVREVIDPMMVQSRIIDTLELEEGDRVITNKVWVCTSHYDVYFKGVIYTFKGLLLIFGAFLAWQTRTVKIPELNDSQYIGVCVYNVAVLSLLGAVLLFALEDHVVLSYIVSCCIIIFATTVTQIIIFIPKVAKFRPGQGHDDEQPSASMKRVYPSTSAESTNEANQLKKDINLTNKLLQDSEKKVKDLTTEIETLKSTMQSSNA